MSRIKFEIGYNGIERTNLNDRRDTLARKSRYILENRLVLEDPIEIKAGFYARLSKGDGDAEVSDSIVFQLEAAKRFFNENPSFIHEKNYIDDGYSGLDFDRPDFQRMMDDINNGVINCIVVRDMSRAGRNYKGLGIFLHKTIRELGVRFLSILDEYDSDDDEDELPKLGIMLRTVIDEHTSEDMSKKITSSIRARQEQGEFLPPAGSIPYGYLRDAINMTYKVDEEPADVVLKIYTMRSERKSISAITNYLNEQDIPSPGKLRYQRGVSTDEKLKESQWARSTVRKILTDVAYIGHRVHGRRQKESFHLPKKETDSSNWTIIENAHPAIVPDALFYTVQKTNEEENGKQASQNKRQDVDVDYRDIFKGKVFCGDCGESMIGKKNTARANSQSTSFIYYECGKYLNSDRRNCKSHYVKGETVAKKITEELLVFAGIIQSKEFAKNIITPLKYDLVMIRKQVLDTREKKEKVSDDKLHNYENYIDGIITREEFLERAIPLREKQSELKEQELELRKQMDAMDDKLDLIKEWITVLRRFQKEPVLTAELVNTFVERVDVSEGQRISVKCKFSQCN